MIHVALNPLFHKSVPFSGIVLTTLTVVIVLFSNGCISTSSPDPADSPIRLLGWRELVLGHPKYTPEEKANERCRYRNRLPDGTRSGFQNYCRREAAKYPMGINAAMYSTSCVIDMCRAKIDQWDFEARVWKSGSVGQRVGQRDTGNGSEYGGYHGR